MANANILESTNIDGVQIKDFADQAAYNTATGTELPSTSANKIMTIIGGIPVLINDAGALTTLVTLTGTQTLTNKTLTTPSIGSFASATHDHSNAAGGGTLGAAAIASGQIAIANGGTGQATQTAAMDALSPTTTKGDLLVDDGTNVIRLAAGTNGHVLKAASGETAGLQWAAESGGGSAGLVAIADVTLGSAASSIQFTSIPGTYAHLKLVGQLRTDRASSTVDGFELTFNSDTGATSYSWRTFRIIQTNAITNSIDDSDPSIVASDAIIAADASTGYFSTLEIVIPNYANATLMRFSQGHASRPASAAGHARTFFDGIWKNTSEAITQIDIAPVVGSNFIAGSRLTLYGMVDA